MARSNHSDAFHGYPSGYEGLWFQPLTELALLVWAGRGLGPEGWVVMSVKDAPESVGALDSTHRRNRGLTIAVVVLTVITLGLAGWLAYLLLAPQGNAVSDDVAQVAEEYGDAWNNHDGAAFMGLVTADYQLYISPGESADNAEQTAAMISTDLKTLGWSVERQGPAQMIGDEDTVKVSELDVLRNGSVVVDEGVSVITLVNQDGTWKVQQHTWGGQ